MTENDIRALAPDFGVWRNGGMTHPAPPWWSHTHRHKLKLEKTTPYSYHLRCQHCGGLMAIDKFVVRIALKDATFRILERVDVRWLQAEISKDL